MVGDKMDRIVYHTYKNAGVYNVNLSAYNEDGQVSKKAVEIVVSPSIMKASPIEDTEAVSKSSNAIGLGFMLLFLFFIGKNRDKKAV
ncbi:MAG: PKD domain-containing protein [Nanoarchaeota archaeon]